MARPALLRVSKYPGRGLSEAPGAIRLHLAVGPATPRDPADPAWVDHQLFYLFWVGQNRGRGVVGAR